MFTAACPNCGADIVFRSIALPVRVCDFCRSTVVRSGEDLTAMGKVAAVPEDVSPLQLGTRGRHDGKSFELIGRIRWRWSDGAWNEWVMLFEGGTQGWLGDAACRYSVLFEQPNGAKGTRILTQFRKGEPVQLGQEMSLGGVRHTVVDVRQVECVASEGELPYSTPVGLTMKSIDLTGDDGQSASLQKDRGQISIYRGVHVSLAALAPTGLRAFEGWAMPGFVA